MRDIVFDTTRLPLKYSQDKSVLPSPMELKIANKLTEHNIPFATEAQFAGCKNPKTGQFLKFDFYCYAHNLLIEYDGFQYHLKDEVKRRDQLKNEFARRVKIPLVRLKNRKEMLEFFKQLPKPDKKETKILDLEIQMPAKQDCLTPPTDAAEIDARIEKMKLTEEIKTLMELKGKSQNDYVKRIKYLFDHKRKMFTMVVNHLKEQKAAS